MNAITLGKSNGYVKGMVSQIYRDPATGNIVGYDNVGSEGAINIEFNQGLIEAGFTNPVVGMIPDSVRVTGTYTSQAFNLETRQLETGGTLKYGGKSSICEEVTPQTGTLTVTKTPVRPYGQSSSDNFAWCWVKEHGTKEWDGTAYKLDLTSKNVTDFVAVSGTTYDVIYFIENVSAQELTIYDNFKPQNIAIEQQYGLYVTNDGNANHGSLKAIVHVHIPLAVLTGSAGMTGSQTDLSTTDGSWQALSDTSVANTLCDDCNTIGNPLMYYVIVPCDGEMSEVKDLAVIGSGITLASGETGKLNFVGIMPDGSTAKLDPALFTFASSSTSIATVGEHTGLVTGVATGQAVITITDTATGNLETQGIVEVTA